MGGTHGYGKEESKAPQRKWILYIYFLIEVQGCLKSNFVETIGKIYFYHLIYR